MPKGCMECGAKKSKRRYWFCDDCHGRFVRQRAVTEELDELFDRAIAENKDDLVVTLFR